MKTGKIFLALFLVLPAICSAQDTKSNAQFTQDEFNMITRYLRDGNIPVLADSLTMLAAQTLRVKVDSVLSGKKLLRSLSFSRNESDVLVYIMRVDVVAASLLLRLNQKLAPVMANGKVNKKKESEK